MWSILPSLGPPFLAVKNLKIKIQEEKMKKYKKLFLNEINSIFKGSLVNHMYFFAPQQKIRVFFPTIVKVLVHSYF